MTAGYRSISIRFSIIVVYVSRDNGIWLSLSPRIISTYDTSSMLIPTLMSKL